MFGFDGGNFGRCEFELDVVTVFVGFTVSFFGIRKSGDDLSVLLSSGIQHFEPILHKPLVIKYASQYSAM